MYMDNPLPNMDISSQHPFDRSRLKPDIRTISIPAAPISFWLRLAGSFTTAASHAVDYSRLRTIADFEIILQVSGTTWFWIDEAGSIDIAPGDVLFIPPRFVHGQAYTEGTHSVAHFDFHANPALGAYDNLHPTGKTVYRRPSISLPVFQIEQERPASALTLPLVTAVKRPLVWREYLSRLTALNTRERPLPVSDQALVCEALGWMLRELASDAAQMDISARGSRDARVAALIDEQDLSTQGDLNVAQMARSAEMGETAFRQSFMRLTGRPPHAFLEERRIAQATHLLVATDLPIKEIASASGYDDPYHFSRVYRRVTGTSPRDFRHKVANRPGTRISAGHELHADH